MSSGWPLTTVSADGQKYRSRSDGVVFSTSGLTIDAATNATPTSAVMARLVTGPF